MPTGALPTDVRVQVAFGARPDAASPTWTTVNDWVISNPGEPSVRITSGRTADSPGLAGRTAEFELDNRDGRFDPRNASGPYHPGVRPLVPVRVQAWDSTASIWRGLFRGAVLGGWPQDRLSARRTVPVRAVDALGLMASTVPPASAFEAEVAALRAEGRTCHLWARSSRNGWDDEIGGHRFPAGSVMVEGDPLVDGDAGGGWKDEDGTVVGLNTSSTVPGWSTNRLYCWWQRIEPRVPGAATVWSIEVGGNRATVTIDSEKLHLLTHFGTVQTATTTAGGTSLLGMSSPPVFVAIWVGTSISSSAIWINGSLVSSVYDASSLAGFVQEFRINGVSGAYDLNRWRGQVDHLQFWSASSQTAADEIVHRLWSAGRLARAGDRLDERGRWLLSASGWGLVAPLDVSTGDYMTVFTSQGYRTSSSVLEQFAKLEETEQGLVWVDNDGYVHFAPRHWPVVLTGAMGPLLVFRDDGTALTYSAEYSRIVDDDRQVVNEARVTSEFGRMQVVRSSASIAKYGVRSVHLSGLLHGTDQESRSIAEWLVLRGAEPVARVEVLSFSASHPTPSGQVAAAIEARPGLMVEVRRDGVDYRGHIVGVDHEIGLTTWRVGLHVSGFRVGDIDTMIWDNGSGTVGTPWDDGLGGVAASRPWTF